ncbi:MAG: NADH-quinone oxidoreductase subunit NuoE [Clostridiales bacterium]|nr:NADH-quinone oxidoreductase subunit NuoE [Clostridiales bacterium]
MSCTCGNIDSKYYEPFEEIMAESYHGSEADLIPVLQKLQHAYGYLPKDIITRLSEKTGIFVTRIMGVATFYSQFRLKPSGEKTIKICFGTACHVNGAEKVADALCDELKIELGETTPDNKFTLESVACLGCCSLAPVMMIGDETYGRLTPDKVRKIIRELKAEGDRK